MTISKQQEERYRQLRVERHMSQDEARVIVGIGRTSAWSLDRERGLADAKSAEPKAPRPKSKPTQEDTSEIEQHIREQERSGVIPAGTAAAFDHGPDESGLPVALYDPTSSESDRPRRGALVFIQGEARALGTVREFGELVHPDDAFPMPTSGRPHSPVRIHVGRESPSDVHRFARMTSHR